MTAEAQSRFLYLYQNVHGLALADPENEARFLALYQNVHGSSLEDPQDEARFLYLYGDTNTDQPHATIVSETPNILEMGEPVTIKGWNFEGRNDGGDMQPEIRFYSGTDITGSYQVLTPVEWRLSTNEGVLMDEVDALMPSPPPVLPGAGYLVIVHTGTDANPYRAYSNFYPVVIQIDEETLDYIDFDAAADDPDWPTSASQASYWIGAASLSSKLYVTSKRGQPFSFDGTTLEKLTVSDFVDPAPLNEKWSLYNDATGGTFTLDVGSDTTGDLAYNITAAALETAIEGLPETTDVTITGAGTAADPWIIEFLDPAAFDIITMATDDTNLVGGTSTITEIQKGGGRGDPANTFPQAFFAARKHDRMWAANVKYADGTQHKSRLHYSDPLAPEAWWADDFVDFDPDDGQEITGLIAYGEGLLVFKNHNVQMLTGMSEASFARQTLISNTGTVSPYTIAIIGGKLYFMDRDSGVWSFDGAEFNLISQNIRSYLLEGINYGAMFTAAGFSYQDKYVLSVPWGSDAHPMRSFVFDTTTESWTEYDFGFRDAVAARDRIYSVAPAADMDGVFQMNTGDTDEGVDIDASFETPWIAPGGHSNKHRTRRIDMAFANLGGAVKIGQYNDFDPTTPTYEAQRTVSDPSSDQVLNLLDGFAGTRWETMQLRVENVDGSDFQLNRVTLLWTALDRRQGVYG